MSRGKRESSWLVIRRCFSIIRRVQRSPATKDELIKAVQAVEPEAYSQNDKQTKLFHKDLARIRTSLFVNIKFDRSYNEYSIHDSDLPLLDLPDDDLATIAFLEQTFIPRTPNYKEIQAFLEQLKFYLSPSRRKVIAKQRQALVMDLGQRDDDRLDPDVEAGLLRALERRKRVEFAYLSPHYDDKQPRRHVVDFYEPIYFDPQQGHHYVQGYCHHIVSSTGRETVNNYRTYRLGRISEVKLLPNKLPPSPPIPKLYDVIYKLSLDIVGSGVTRKRWINIKKIEYQADGVVVYGTTTNIFFAVQNLMHYQHKCEIVGGTEMLSRVRESVQKMAELYKLDLRS